VRAQAAPQSKQQSKININGQLEELAQAGWIIQYRYSQAQQTLPERIEASSTDTRLTLIIRDWREHASTCTPK
jgi:outer membrane biogenesis lipoprotein LolB